MLKLCLVRLVYKKDDSNKIKNYRPVSLLNGFSKVYERFLYDSLSTSIDKKLSKFVSTYRKSYSSNHILLKLTEEWRKSLDDRNIIVAMLMDLFKSVWLYFLWFVVAKIHPNGLFIYSYLKRREWNDKKRYWESVKDAFIRSI